VSALGVACTTPAASGTPTTTTTTTPVPSGTPVVIDDTFQWQAECGLSAGVGSGSPQNVPAGRFVVAGSPVALTRATVGLWTSVGIGGPLTARVLVVPTRSNPAQGADTADEPDMSTVLASADVGTPVATCGITQTVAFGSPPLLQPGAYWLVVEPLAGVGAWELAGVTNSPCPMKTRAYGQALTTGSTELTWRSFNSQLCGLAWYLEGVQP
jgi:hypothetical protein